MIKVRLQIENEKIYDSYDAYGLIYVSADDILGAPIKPFEKTSYPEEEGEHIFPWTTDQAFDYKVKWFVAPKDNTLNGANKIIANFNSLLYAKEGNVKRFKRVTFYNDYKNIKIVGIPSPISEAVEFWREGKGDNAHNVAIVEWVIRVDKPSLCDFNISV